MLANKNETVTNGTIFHQVMLGLALGCFALLCRQNACYGVAFWSTRVFRYHHVGIGNTKVSCWQSIKMRASNILYKHMYTDNGDLLHNYQPAFTTE